MCSCTALLLVSKLTVIFSGLLSQQHQYVKALSISFFWHLSMHVPCSNHCRTEWVRKLRLVIQNPSHHNVSLFFRICPTFWCAACKYVLESFSSTYVQCIPANIYAISSPRYHSLSPPSDDVPWEVLMSSEGSTNTNHVYVSYSYHQPTVAQCIWQIQLITYVQTKCIITTRSSIACKKNFLLLQMKWRRG